MSARLMIPDVQNLLLVVRQKVDLIKKTTCSSHKEPRVVIAPTAAGTVLTRRPPRPPRRSDRCVIFWLWVGTHVHGRLGVRLAIKVEIEVWVDLLHSIQHPDLLLRGILVELHYTISQTARLSKTREPHFLRGV